MNMLNEAWNSAIGSQPTVPCDTSLLHKEVDRGNIFSLTMKIMMIRLIDLQYRFNNNLIIQFENICLCIQCCINL